jgi:hypothetical protein
MEMLLKEVDLRRIMNRVIDESVEYANINFDEINSVDGLTYALKNNVLEKLIPLSNLVINLPAEKRYDLSSTKSILGFLNTIKKDIDTARSLFDDYESNEEIANTDSFGILDTTLFKIDMIYDSLFFLFDKLDSLFMEIDDDFDVFIDDVKKHLK